MPGESNIGDAALFQESDRIVVGRRVAFPLFRPQIALDARADLIEQVVLVLEMRIKSRRRTANAPGQYGQRRRSAVLAQRRDGFLDGAGPDVDGILFARAGDGSLLNRVVCATLYQAAKP